MILAKQSVARTGSVSKSATRYSMRLWLFLRPLRTATSGMRMTKACLRRGF